MKHGKKYVDSVKAYDQSKTYEPAEAIKIVIAGAKAKFTVTASGGSLKYQWQWSGDSGMTWTDSTSKTSGYNTKTLQVSATTGRNGYLYRCKVFNAAGTVFSSSAKLTVVTKPVISTQPKAVSAAAGTTAKFTVTAAGG